MSGPSHLHQGGSEFASTVQGHSIDLGNKSFTQRDKAHTINHNYFASTPEIEHRGGKRKYDDEIGFRNANRAQAKTELPGPTDRNEEEDFGYERLLKSLEFPQIDARHENIRKAHAKTCKWILKKSEYLDWLNPSKIQEHHGFLWIKGKPGAGKSTLMKFLLSNARSRMKDRIVIFFFFNARGQTLEKSTIGMYRSLLRQLLPKVRNPQCALDPDLLSKTSETHEWGIEALRTLFEEVVQSLRSRQLVLFIDALDECNVDDIRYMISSFKELGDFAVSADIMFHVCFASRHYPYITMPKKVELFLENQEGHEEDIMSYLDSQLVIGDSKLAKDVRLQVQQKASGVFMWVVLVTDILQKQHDGGRDHQLKQTLREIPDDLHELFRDILTRDGKNKDELLLCIQWVLFARQPLKPEQLYFAIRSEFENTVLQWDRDVIQDDIIGKFILDTSKGLAEVTRSKKDPTIQFIHESVRDFLLKDNGLEIFPMGSVGGVQAESHERLKKSCFNYTKGYIVDHSPDMHSLRAGREEATEARKIADSKFPFLMYAVQNVLYHANAAGEGNVDQNSFLASFPLVDWINLNNLFETMKVRQYTSDASLLYVLAEHNLGSLIDSHVSSQSCFDIEHERYGAPVLAAMATASTPTIWRLLKRDARNEPSESRLRTLCDEFIECQHEFKIGRNFKFQKKRGLLFYILESGDGILTAFALISCKAITDLDLATATGQELLLFACRLRNHCGLVIEVLLDKGADIEARSRYGQTPLSRAAENGNVTATKLLLEKGASVETEDHWGRTPLSRAAAMNQESTVTLLLSKGANAGSADRDGYTPIFHAVQRDYDAVVRLLVSGGASSEVEDNEGLTPLHHAVSLKGVSVAQTLLDVGAVIGKASPTGLTPLMRAASRGNLQMVKLLVHRGADIHKVDNDGNTALLHAAIDGAMDCQQFLILQGASIEVTEAKSGRSVFSYASECGDKSLVQLLLDQEGLVESRCAAGRTPLSYAALSINSLGLMKALISRGAVVDAADEQGRTPLSYATWEYKSGVFNDVEYARLLLAHGADPNKADSKGRTPLSYAAGWMDPNEDYVRLLLAHGADPSRADENGLTPSDYTRSQSIKTLLGV